jgi:RNA polymerase sigma-70 factor (ECF subfamily)
MSEASLDTLLEKLSSGDQEAAGRVFRDYEPFLRAMVRRRLAPALRSKFDSLDVVQSVWADVFSGIRDKERRFADRSHLRAFLARVTYNHFVNHCRRHGPQAAIERPLYADESPALPPSVEPRPSQVAEADELWTTLVEMCPREHRQVLELKRQGVPLAEIADRTGLHEGSVRRLLYDLAKRLAARSPRSSLPQAQHDET